MRPGQGTVKKSKPFRLPRSTVHNLESRAKECQTSDGVIAEIAIETYLLAGPFHYSTGKTYKRRADTQFSDPLSYKSISLPLELLADIRLRAMIEDVTQNELVENALNRFLPYPNSKDLQEKIRHLETRKAIPDDEWPEFIDG